MVSLKDSAAPVAKTEATATAKQTKTNADVNQFTNNKLLNLPPRKSHKKSNLKNNKIIVDYWIDNNIYNILNIAKKVTYLEEQNRSTQRAVAQLRQLVSISVQFHKDELARNRERRF